MTMLLEASEEGIGESYDRDSGRIVWTVRYTLEGEEENGSQLTDIDQSQRMQQRQLQHHHHHRVDKKKVQVRLEIQKDDIQAVLPISKVAHDFLIDQTQIPLGCTHIHAYVYSQWHKNTVFLSIQSPLQS